MTAEPPNKRVGALPGELVQKTRVHQSSVMTRQRAFFYCEKEEGEQSVSPTKLVQPIKHCAPHGASPAW